jgi:Arc/MetJ-type ribon-helix-helix transcriptional regulator
MHPDGWRHADTPFDKNTAIDELEQAVIGSLTGKPRRLTMSYSFPPDVEKQMRDRLASGQYASEDDVLRNALSALAWEEHEASAVLEAVAALESGEKGIPLADAIAQIRLSTCAPDDA